MTSLSVSELELLRNSGEFDENWYVQRYPDVKMLGMDPAAHYLWIGRKLGRDPKPTFSSSVRQEARDQIIKTVEGRQSRTDALCLFSHFDIHGEIDPYVADYLRQLSDAGFCIVFVTTCEDIQERELAKVGDYVMKFIVKRNIGRDFGAWFTGVVDSWDAHSYERVLLANDSVYGPIFDLSDILDDMNDRPLDVWGITDSYETSYHIQTYFVMFEPTFATSSSFIDFWDRYRFEVNKRAVIENFEIGLTSFATNRGFRVGALCNYYDARRQAISLLEKSNGIGRAVRQSKLTPVNASHFFWRALVERCHCPFIKVELLRDNPSGIDDVQLWEEVVGRYSAHQTHLMRRHLRRVRPPEADQDSRSGALSSGRGQA